MNGDGWANPRTGFTAARPGGQSDPGRGSEAGTEPISCEDRAKGRIRAEFQIGQGGRGAAVLGVWSTLGAVR